MNTQIIHSPRTFLPLQHIGMIIPLHHSKLVVATAIVEQEEREEGD